jgi:hypothetical protein
MKKLLVPRRRLLKAAIVGIATPYVKRVDAAAAFGMFQVAGNAGNDIWVGLDGRQNALAGASGIYPHLLDTYNGGFGGGINGRYRAVTVGGQPSYQISDAGRRQPPWMVAGVDYAVGCPIAAGSFGSNVAVSGSSFTGAFTAKCGSDFNLTSFPTAQIINPGSYSFDSWDLTGVNFYANPSVGNVILTFNKCLLGGGTTGWQFNMAYSSLLQAGLGLTVKYCTIDGAVLIADEVLAMLQMVGFFCAGSFPVDIEYNWFKNGPGQFIAGGGNTNGLLTVKYNLLDNIKIVGWGYTANVTNVANNAGIFRVTLDQNLSLPNGVGLSIQGCTVNPGINGQSVVANVSNAAVTSLDLSGKSASGTLGAMTARFGGNAANNDRGHQNWLQWQNDGGSGCQSDWSFNTCFQTDSGGAEGVQMYFNTGGNFSGSNTSNNTLLGTAPGAMSAITHLAQTNQTSTTLSGSNVCKENYFDTTGGASFYAGTGLQAGWSLSNNKNIVSGGNEP